MKLFKVVAICLLILMVVSPVFAEEPKKDVAVKFTYGGWAGVYGYVVDQLNNWLVSPTGDNTAGISTRFRQYLTAQVGSAQAVVKFEMDPTFGDDGNDTGPTATVSDAGIGTDLKGELQIKNAYIAFDKGMISVKAGLAFATMPTSLILGDDAPLVQVAAKLGDMVAKFIYITPSQDDGDLLDNVLQVDLALKAGGLTINPGLLYRYTKDTTDNATLYIPQISIKGPLGPLTLDFQFAYAIAKMDSGTGDTTAYSTLLKLNYKMDKMNHKFFLNVLSGDDATTAGKDESFGQFTLGIYPGLTDLFYFGWHLANSMAGGRGSIGGGDMLGNLGVMTIGYKFSMDVNDFTFNLLGAYHKAMDDVGDAYGIEVNLGVDWKLMQNLEVNFGVDFFSPGDAITDFTKLGWMAYLGTKIKW